MKRLEISKLMDEYTDTEFFPTGGSAADPEEVRRRVLAAVPAGQRRTAPKRRLFLAAAVAAVMVILMGAGLPYMIYHLASGTLRFTEGPSSHTVTFQHHAPLMELEEGRLYFVLDGQRTDITDQISEDTPYIYDGSDPETGLTYYVILGATPEGYGWLEWITAPAPFLYGQDGAAEDSEMAEVYSFRWMTLTQDGEDEDLFGGMGVGALRWSYAVDHPWLLAGAKQLDIPFVDTESNTNDIFYVS